MGVARYRGYGFNSVWIKSQSEASGIPEDTHSTIWEGRQETHPYPENVVDSAKLRPLVAKTIA